MGKITIEQKDTKQTLVSQESFEFEPKDTKITLRLSSGLLKAVKKRAKREGLDYQKLLRRAVEWFLTQKL